MRRMDNIQIKPNSELTEKWDLVKREIGHRRQLVLFLTDNSEECIDLYALFLRDRMPVIMIEAQISEKKRHGLIEKFHPSWIVMPEKQDQLGMQNITRDGVPYQKITRYHHYTLRKNSKQDIWKLHTLASEIAVLLSTSGSTGEGKFVKLSYDNLFINAQSIISSLGMQKGDRAALMLPMAYSYGLSVVNSCLLSGGTLLSPRGNITHKKYWDDLEKGRVQSICGVPYTYELLKKLRVFDRPLKDLKLITQAGGRLSVNIRSYLLAELERRRKQGQNIDFAIMYGQTEATARMSSYFVNHHLDKADSVGKAISGGRFLIEDRDPSGVGEIVYEGGNVYMGYATTWRDLLAKDAKDEAGTSFRLHTGDIGRLDADGYLYIVGRKKRIIKRYGYRIPLDELQEEISKKANCPLICVHGEQEALDRIYIVAEQEAYMQDAAVLQRLIEPVLGEYHIRSNDYCIVKISGFARNSYGKPDYKAIYQMVEREVGI